MAAIFPTAFSSKKNYDFGLKCHWILDGLKPDQISFVKQFDQLSYKESDSNKYVHNHSCYTYITIIMSSKFETKILRQDELKTLSLLGMAYDLFGNIFSIQPGSELW